MSSDDPNFKRLGTILFMFVFMIVIASLQSVLLTGGGSSTYEDLLDETKNIGIFDVMIDIIGFFIGGFLLKILFMPMYMIFVITPIYLLGVITFWYLVLDFLKDISILGTSL